MTREEAKLTVDYLKEMQEEYIEDEGYERYPLPEWYALDKAIELIEQTRWIPVSERLPEIQNYTDNYLVTLKRGGVHISMFTECDGKHWWTYDDVIAWMPLPNPYKAESEV